MSVEFLPFPTEQSAEDALYNELRNALSENTTHGPDTAPGTAGGIAPHVVMLAGGTSPINVYRRIQASPPQLVHPNAHIVLSDDRLVPEHDERSNYSHIRPMANALGLPESRVVHVDGAMRGQSSLMQFQIELRSLLQRDAFLALGILGIGADGHTASLFSPDQVNLAQTRVAVEPGAGTLRPDPLTELAIASGMYQGTERISLSATVLLAFRTLIFFATGPAKRDIIYELTRHPEDYPAGRILQSHPNAHIWTDEAPSVK